MFYNFVFSLNVYLTLLLGLSAVLGDYIVSHTKIHVFQAIFDNVTHAVIGGLSWFIICVNYKKDLSSLHIIEETALCAIIASIIDIDHFIAAKSLNLKDATQLKGRPPFHCSTFPLSIVVLLLAWSHVVQWSNLRRYTLIILVAFVSHHTRDATRRGYWFYPYGSTPPLSYGVYVTLTCVIPYFIYYLYKYIDVSNSREDRLTVI